MQTTEAQSEALTRALEQIDIAFGKYGNLTPDQRRNRAQRRLVTLEAIYEGLLRLSRADALKDRDEQGWTEIDPVIAYVIGWYLRKEADSDNVISESGEASDALEEAAAHIESGEILADPQQIEAEVWAEIEALKAEIETAA